MERRACIPEKTALYWEAEKGIHGKGDMEKMTLLVVDDEARIRSLIAKYAAFEGYSTEEAENGMQALEKCREKKYDLIILDVMMPELDGFSAVREIRKVQNTPVIMLSARGEEYDRIHGFELGVDDYVVKPFSPRELLMRVGAVLKRSGGLTESTDEVVTIGDLEINFTARRVSVCSTPKISVVSDKMAVPPQRISLSMARPRAGLAERAEKPSLPPHLRPTVR